MEHFFDRFITTTHTTLIMSGRLQDEWYRQPSTVAPEWPSKGVIELKGLTLRYRDDLEPVIHNLSLSVQGAEKVKRSSTLIDSYR